jgi:hypothetical protein
MRKYIEFFLFFSYFSKIRIKLILTKYRLFLKINTKLKSFMNSKIILLKFIMQKSLSLNFGHRYLLFLLIKLNIYLLFHKIHISCIISIQSCIML